MHFADGVDAAGRRTLRGFAWRMLAGGLPAALPVLAAAAALDHGPVLWHEDDRRRIAEPREREPSLAWDYFDDSVFLPLARFLDPARAVRTTGTLFGGDHVPPAQNVNALDEVPNSSWFTNRIGLFPMSPRAAAAGPGPGTGPDRSDSWTVISGKSQGVTPGFNIRDAAGNAFLVKFDPPGHPGMTTGAGAICARILHAAGYNVPDDVVVSFRREDLRLDRKARIRDASGKKRPMTEADLDEILTRVPQREDGSYHAISSRFVSGKPIGPFDYHGRRKDDPNDRVSHQHRRELRGLRIFAAWINHFDTKQHNSLDVFTEDGHVRHYLIDFASTLGAGAQGPTPRYGHEYTVDLAATGRRLFGFGFWEDPWRRLERPSGLSEIGYFGIEEFSPLAFDPLQPNSAFVNLTDRDGYWAAKIISAFRDEHLRAICEEARYEDPRAAEYVAHVLGERRDVIAREFFDRVAPLDFFRWEGERLTFHDLGQERGVYPGTQPRYRVRLSRLDADRNVLRRTDWIDRDRPDVEARALEGPEDEFLELECQVDHGRGWSGSVKTVFSTRTRTVVEVDRG